MKNLSKNVRSFIYAAILSGLGYGVWTKIITPLFNWIFNNLVHFWDLSHSNIIDRIYKRGLQEEVTIWYEDIRSFIGFILVIALYFFITKLISNWKDIYSNQRYRKTPITLNILTSTSYSLLLISAISINLQVYLSKAQMNISSYAYKGIEIVRPNMTELEYLELKSKILQGKSKSDFNAISEKLKSYADDNHVLPEEPTL